MLVPLQNVLNLRMAEEVKGCCRVSVLQFSNQIGIWIWLQHPRCTSRTAVIASREMHQKLFKRVYIYYFSLRVHDYTLFGPTIQQTTEVFIFASGRERCTSKWLPICQSTSVSSSTKPHLCWGILTTTMEYHCSSNLSHSAFLQEERLGTNLVTSWELLPLESSGFGHSVVTSRLDRPCAEYPRFSKSALSKLLMQAVAQARRLEEELDEIKVSCTLVNILKSCAH